MKACRISSRSLVHQALSLFSDCCGMQTACSVKVNIEETRVVYQYFSLVNAFLFGPFWPVISSACEELTSHWLILFSEKPSGSLFRVLKKKLLLIFVELARGNGARTGSGISIL